MALTYQKITTVEVGSGGAATISFTSIPGTYTDLQLVFSARTSRSANGDYVLLSLNSAEANNGLYLWGYGTTVVSGTATNAYIITVGNTATSSTFSNNSIYIPNYTSSTAKSISVDSSAEDNTSESQGNSLAAGLWSSGSASTSAITSITLTGRFASFVQYSTATLYGIKNS